GAFAFLVDRRDLDFEHESDRRSARGRQRLRDCPLDIIAKAIEAGLGRDQLVFELGAPGGMREVAGTNDADACARRPGREVLEIEIPTGRTRIFRVDVQIRVEAHAMPRLLMHLRGGPDASARAGTFGSDSLREGKGSCGNLWVFCAPTSCGGERALRADLFFPDVCGHCFFFLLFTGKTPPSGL